MMGSFSSFGTAQGGASSCAAHSLPRIKPPHCGSPFRNGGCFKPLLVHRLPRLTRHRQTLRLSEYSLRATSEQPQLFRNPGPDFNPQKRIQRILSTTSEATSDAPAHLNHQAHVGETARLPVHHDARVTLLVLAGAWAWVRLFDFLTKQNLLNQKLSRKLVHITSGLLFALCWPLYSASPLAPYAAAVVPLCNALRLLVYGLGFLKDEGLVKSVSREGDPRELLRGPLYYVMVLILSTILFWRDSPVGVMALAMMCGGDGIADIVGRRFGSRKLPWNSGKSWAGSVAMFTFGLLVSWECLCYFAFMGYYRLDARGTLIRLAGVSFAATVVESLPVSTKLDDNVTVPLTTVVVGLLLFPPGGRVLGLPSDWLKHSVNVL